MTLRHMKDIDNMIKCHKSERKGCKCMENNLKELRLLKKKTQLQVMLDTGIEQALLSKYENGMRVPPTETLIALADYYNVSMDYIMKRTDKKEINH